MVYYDGFNENFILPIYFLDNKIDKLILINNTTGEEYNVDMILTWLFDNVWNFRGSEIKKLNLPKGEYTYKLGKDIGLLTIGDYKPTEKQYQIDEEATQYQP